MTAILIGGEKGGTGKSTIATNLSIMAKLMGKDVLLIDSDKQSTSSRFINYRHELEMSNTPLCVEKRGNNLHKEIQDFASRYEIVIIDAGGRDSAELRSAMSCKVVSKFYIPLQPSEFDLDTLGTMNDLLFINKSYNYNLESLLVFNQAPTHNKINTVEDAIETSKEFENINISNSIIRHRIAFQYAASQSLSVVEFELKRIESMPSWQLKNHAPKASMEICALFKEIFGYEFLGDINKYFIHSLDEAV